MCVYVCASVSTATSFIIIMSRWQSALQVIDLDWTWREWARSWGRFYPSILISATGSKQNLHLIFVPGSPYLIQTPAQLQLIDLGGIDSIWVMKFWFLGKLRRWLRIFQLFSEIFLLFLCISWLQWLKCKSMAWHHFFKLGSTQAVSELNLYLIRIWHNNAWGELVIISIFCRPCQSCP